MGLGVFFDKIVAFSGGVRRSAAARYAPVPSSGFKVPRSETERAIAAFSALSAFSLISAFADARRGAGCASSEFRVQGSEIGGGFGPDGFWEGVTMREVVPADACGEASLPALPRQVGGEAAGGGMWNTVGRKWKTPGLVQGNWGLLHLVAEVHGEKFF